MFYHTLLARRSTTGLAKAVTMLLEECTFYEGHHATRMVFARRVIKLDCFKQSSLKRVRVFASGRNAADANQIRATLGPLLSHLSRRGFNEGGTFN